MKNGFSILLITITSLNLYSQDSILTVYGKLPVFYIPNGGFVSVTNLKNETTFSINNKNATEPEYNQGLANISRCRPCVVKDYNENNIQISESISYLDCLVGWQKIFFPNGKLKLLAQYKENKSNLWDNLWERGLCSNPDGNWIYFNEQGDTLYTESWSGGVFIKQTPEQLSVEIWDIEILLHGQKIDQQLLKFNEVGNLEIKPLYKNSTISNKLTVGFEVSAIGYKVIEKRFTLKSFYKIDIDSMLNEAGIPKDKTSSFVLSIYNNDQIIKQFYLNLIR